jgi:hypothetical protein
MSLLLLLTIVALQSSPAISDPVVSYSGYKVWAISPRTNEENQFLGKMSQQYGMAHPVDIFSKFLKL